MSKSQRIDYPNLPKDSVLAVASSVIINCPASHAFDILLDTSTWPEWNSFMPQSKVEPPKSSKSTSKPSVLVKGSKLDMKARMKAGTSLSETLCLVTELDRTDPAHAGSPGSDMYRVSWIQQSYSRMLLRTNRTSDFRDIQSTDGEAKCEFRTYESMAGPLAYTVKLMFHDTLQQRFEEMADDLRRYVEKTWGEKQSSKA